MNGFFKVINSILGILAVVVCLATVGIIAYTATHPHMAAAVLQEEAAAATVTPTAAGGGEPSESPAASPAQTPGHIHEYVENIDLQATCIGPGRLKYICGCGDYYYTETPTVGHAAGGWETVTEAAETAEGLRVQKCIYCDEILKQEVLAATGGEKGTEKQGHIHEYKPVMESEPTCTVAGIRRYTCNCGSYYRENISAIGHLAGGWEVVREATVSEIGLQQKICGVCQTLIDSRETGKLTPSPSPTGNQTNTASPATPTPSPAPSPTPHTHNYVWYVKQEATCNAIGIKTGNCSCGEEKIEKIDINKTSHKYSATIIPPNVLQGGYTLHVCAYCGDSYTDNKIPALSGTEWGK